MTTLQQVIQIIKKHVPEDCKIFLFGSQVNWKATSRSDYDIGILCNKKIPLSVMSRIWNEVEELPIRVDIVDFNAVSSLFKQEVFSWKIKTIS